MVKIKNYKSFVNSQTKLNNGTLVIHYSITGAVLHEYLIIPFRNNKNKEEFRATQQYCSLIDLETGRIAFEEPCSRNTDIYRILCHLNKSSYYGESAVKEQILNQSLSIHPLHRYDLEIQIKGEEE